MNPGTIYLVGGGPGAPELITEKGAQILRRAEVVFYDPAWKCWYPGIYRERRNGLRWIR